MMQDTINAALAFATQHLLLSVFLFIAALLLMRARALGAELRSWLLLAVFALAVLTPFAAFLPDSSPREPSATAQAVLMPTPAEGPTLDEQVFQDGRSPGMLYLEIPKSYPTVLALAWLLGTLWQLMRFVEGWNNARRMRRCARPAPALETALADALPRSTRIAVTTVDGPMVVGLLRPCILIPRVLAQTLDQDALRDILQHEIAHIRRGDLWLSAAMRVALAVFWWNPMLRLVHARLELAREMACDLRAALGRRGPVEYAGSLLTSVETLAASDERPATLAVGIFERRGHLAQRIDGLIDAHAEPAPRRRLVAIASCVGLLLAFAGVAVTSAPRLDPPARANTKPDADVVELLAAARAGDNETVQRLVRNGTDVDARILDEGTALIQAVRSRQLDTVDMLLQLGANPNRAALGEGSPLIVASQLGFQVIVERLVKAGADVNRVVTYDETPLINAARRGHLETVRYLVAQGADVNLGVVADGWLGRWRSPLNQARDPAVRAYLASQGAIAGLP